MYFLMEFTRFSSSFARTETIIGSLLKMLLTDTEDA